MKCNPKERRINNIASSKQQPQASSMVWITSPGKPIWYHFNGVQHRWESQYLERILMFNKNYKDELTSRRCLENMKSFPSWSHWQDYTELQVNCYNRFIMQRKVVNYAFLRYQLYGFKIQNAEQIISNWSCHLEILL